MEYIEKGGWVVYYDRERERCVHYVCWILVQLFKCEIGNSVFPSSFNVGYEYYRKVKC